MGVEEELLLVDPPTARPARSADRWSRSADERLPDDSGPGGVERELKREQVELNSDPTTSLDDLRADLHHLRRRLADAASRNGLGLAALATSPVPVEPTSTRDARYERITREYGLTARELLVNGCHVHVSVGSPDEGGRRARPDAAVAGRRSPRWPATRRTGRASTAATPAIATGCGAGCRAPARPSCSATRPATSARSTRWSRSGAAMDPGMVYLDARLSRAYPTVELRVADVCAEVADAVLIAGLSRALVETSAREWADGVAGARGTPRGAAWRGLAGGPVRGVR